MDDVVAQFHVLDAFRRQQGQGADRPSGLAFAAPNCEPGGDFEAPLKSDGALDVCAIFGSQRRLDVAADLLQRGRERFDICVAQVGVFSYLGDGNAASHPNPGGGVAAGMRLV
jgi:hypothetical protein